MSSKSADHLEPQDRSPVTGLHLTELDAPTQSRPDLESFRDKPDNNSGSSPGKWYQHLYIQVLTAIVVGVLLGHFYPSVGKSMKPLGDAFIKLIKMLIALIIFFTVVHGIASMKDLRRAGRVGLKALIYFEVVTTLALIIGLLVVNLWKPGVGMNVDSSTVDTKSIATFTKAAMKQSTIQFFMDIIPRPSSARSTGEILQVLFFAILFALVYRRSASGASPSSASSTSSAMFSSGSSAM